MKSLPRPTRSQIPAKLQKQPRLEQLEAPKDSDLQFLEIDPVTEADKKAMGFLAGIVFEIDSENVDQQANSRGLQNIVSGASDGLFQTQADQNQIYRHLNQAFYR